MGLNSGDFWAEERTHCQERRIFQVSVMRKGREEEGYRREQEEARAVDTPGLLWGVKRTEAGHRVV